MTIYGSNPPNGKDYMVRSQKVSKKGNEQVAKGEVSEGSASYKVNLSEKARGVEELKRILSEMPDVRDAKVAELRRAIKDGTYEVNADLVAERMLQEIL